MMKMKLWLSLALVASIRISGATVPSPAVPATTNAPAAAAVRRAYTIPVLTVREGDNRRVIAGSGKLNACPFELITLANDAPVKVSVVEDTPSGVGNSLRASLWLAVTTASISMNRDLAGTTVNFETSGCVDGPSAGGIFCLAVMSAIEGREFPSDFAMTGTILADGTIGAVGGVAEKLRAASAAGIKRVCIPASVRMDEDFVDLIDLGRELGLELHQVSTIGEAYRLLHGLLPRQVTRLNPTEVCRLSPPVESVLKSRIGMFIRNAKDNAENWNDTLRKAVDELRAGLFGAAAMDMLDGLEEQWFEGLDGFVRLFTDDSEQALRWELPPEGAPAPEGCPSKAQFIAALRHFAREIDNLGEAMENELEIENPLESAPVENAVTNANAEADWFNDHVESPAAAQFITLSNYHWQKQQLYDSLCADLDKLINEKGNWDSLSADELNEIRERLIAKCELKFLVKSFGDESTPNYYHMDRLCCDLLCTMTYIRPKAGVRRIENVLYRTLRAVDGAINAAALPDSQPARIYSAELFYAEKDHDDCERGGDELRAIFSEIQALSSACALLLYEESGEAKFSAGFNSAVLTARENALANIAECQRLGIPCTMPIICFQIAESLRGGEKKQEDAQLDRFVEFADYLQAGLSAKALVMCFGGQRPELNAKGYCTKGVTFSEDCLTVRYYGVDGEPILRDGFSGFTDWYDANRRHTQIDWLDLKGLAARSYDLKHNVRFLREFDDAGRVKCFTYCNAEWKPTPLEDGVMVERRDYDGDGNVALEEYFGADGQRVTNEIGVASIKRTYNRRGQEIIRRFFDVSGAPAANTDGIYGIHFSYDKRGNHRKTVTVDAAGEPLAQRGRSYAIYKINVDANGRETERAWYDAAEKLVNVDGVARIVYDYDEAGRLITLTNYGADGRLARDLNNIAVARWIYGENGGDAEECRYYGPDGQPTCHREGNAAWKNVFDEAGKLIDRKYYDIDGNEIKLEGAGK